ncbi:uncharacterized protein LOC111333183 [Stylophora pistillata]|uniref:uncharacterized protein LOC111333183 n=1 Tax=Stylophora pistillata TaxID=50429 RepID=UPI000C04820A|nr:uncharacterized protein LOC111333183 [Stylophora pistillata]
MIDHNVLIDELRNMQVHPVLVNWMIAFLCNRTQAVRIENIISEWKTPKGGIPQGTRLGVIFFTIMTNNLLRLWNLRIKFADDTTALEIIPRNSASQLNFVTNDVYAFSEDHRMKLNPTKCKEMLNNFMSNHNFLVNPILIRSNTVKGVTTYKLLGVYVSNDLKWNHHVEVLAQKGNRWIYSLRVLKQCGASPTSLAKVYTTIVRAVLEYAAPVWQNIPDFLSYKIESIQKRAMGILFPFMNYTEALMMMFVLRWRRRP